MTTLAIGASKTISVGDGGTVAIATNGGFFSYSGTTALGVAFSRTFGPGPVRHVIGPLKEGGTVTIVNTSVDSLDWDASPIADPAAIAALVSGAWNAVTNSAALKPFAAKLRDAPFTEVYITGTGDSLFQLGGDTAAPGSDTRSETRGFLACLRRILNARLGTSDGGQWIPAQATAVDTRVANTGGSVSGLSQFGPYNAYLNGAGANISRVPVQLTTGGDNITYTVTGRYLDVEIWENTGTSYNGTCTWTVDGGGGGTLNAASGATDTYRTIRLDLVTDAAHVVSITWATAKVLITGATVTRGAGVVTRRFGYGGSKASQWATLATKQTRTTFQTLTTHLHIIRLSYNDWNNQVADGLTIAAFQGYVQTMITAALANASVLGVLLLADPPTSTADTNPISYAAFAAALQALATGRVAYIDVATAVNSTYAAGNTAGYYVDFVHRTGAGYNAEASAVAEVLLGASLLAV